MPITVHGGNVPLVDVASMYRDPFDEFGTDFLPYGSRVQSAPRSLDIFDPPVLGALIGFCERWGITQFVSDVVVTEQGNVFIDGESFPRVVASEWISTTDLPDEEMKQCFDLQRTMSEMLKTYGKHIPGLSRFSMNGVSHRLSTELRFFPEGFVPDEYDTNLHIDAVSESLTQPVAQLLWATGQPTWVVEREYQWRGTERSIVPGLDWQGAESREHGETLTRLHPKSKELIAAFAPTFLHGADDIFTASRWLLRSYAEPIMPSRVHDFLRPHGGLYTTSSATYGIAHPVR